MGDEVDFLLEDKHESFLQADSVTLGVHSQACQTLFQQFIACDNRTQLSALFQNILKFCTFCSNFQINCPFFALFLKNRTHALTF